MTTIKFCNKNTEKTMETPHAFNAVLDKMEEVLPSIETQLSTSIDLVSKDETIVVLCDGVWNGLFEFIQEIFAREIKKIKA